MFSIGPSADAAAGRAGAGGGYKPISFSKFSGRDSFKAPSDYDPLSVCNSPLRFDGGAPGHGDRDMNDDLESPPRSPPMVRFAEQADRDGDREIPEHGEKHNENMCLFQDL